MDETKTPEQNNIPVESPPAVASPQKPVDGGKKNLILAILVLITGALIIAAVFLIAFPDESKTVSETPTVQSNQVTDVTKTADLDTAEKELDSAELDSYQQELDQIDSSAKDF